MSRHRNPVDRCAGRILGKMRRSARRWKLYEGGSRIAIGLSGGRDSLVLLELMALMREHWHPRLKLLALHLRLNTDGVTVGLPPAIHNWAAHRQIEIIEVIPTDPLPEGKLRCFECSRIRRKTLFQEASVRGFPLLALGHHADDVVETWLMSLFFSGKSDSLPPRRDYFDSTISVIRPMIEIRRAEITRLARLAEVPDPIPACPLEEKGRRRRVKEALRCIRPDEKLVRRHLFWAAMRNFQAPENLRNSPVNTYKTRKSGEMS